MTGEQPFRWPIVQEFDPGRLPEGRTLEEEVSSACTDLQEELQSGSETVEQLYLLEARIAAINGILRFAESGGEARTVTVEDQMSAALTSLRPVLDTIACLNTNVLEFMRHYRSYFDDSDGY